MPDSHHGDLPVITILLWDVCSSEPISTKWVEEEHADEKVKCRIAIHGFKIWVTTELRYAAAP